MFKKNRVKCRDKINSLKLTDAYIVKSNNSLFLDISFWPCTFDFEDNKPYKFKMRVNIIYYGWYQTLLLYFDFVHFCAIFLLFYD